MNEQLYEFHKSNNFLTVAKRLDGNTVKVTFPINLIDYITDINYFAQYTIADKIYKKDVNNRSSSLEVPKYAQRIFVLHDYILLCHDYGISHDLIECLSKDGKRIDGNIVKLFDNPSTEEDKTKEKDFIAFYSELLLGTEPDKNSEFYSDCEKLFELNESGGF